MNLRRVLFAAFALVLNTAAADSSSSLFEAIRGNDLPGIKTLIASGLAANVQDQRGTSALLYAAAFGSADAMRLLIAAGANVNAANSFGSTPLMWAVNDADKVRLLLAKGADVNAKTKMGRSPLTMAAASPAGLEVVNLLLDKGAAVNARDALQSTALIEAASGDIARALIRKGADVNAKNAPGLTALMFAASDGSVEWCKLLLAKGADVNAVSGSSLGPPVKKGLVALGSFTPLLFAVGFGSADLVRVLIDAGADVNAKDVRGMTPLILAIASDHNDPGVVKLLLNRGADPKIKSKDGEDAFDWARKFRSPGVFAAFGMKIPKTDPVERLAKVDYAKPDVRKAAEKGLALVQNTTSQFFTEGGCSSCHAHNLTGMAVSLARSKGLRVDEGAAAGETKATKFQWAFFEQPMMQRVDPPGGADMATYGLVGLGVAGYTADRITDALVFNIAAQQTAAGGWHGGGVARPPMEDGDMTKTAMAVRGLAMYGMRGRKKELDERIARAKAWMLQAPVVTTEDRAMQLLGLRWANAEPVATELLARQIVKLQRADGGWAQTPDLGSDAYGTGQSLYALQAAGTPVTSEAYRRGLAYLIKTQLPDGSWHVISRAPKFQPYFQSGFPHEHDQWISSAGTGWAVMALMAAVEQASVAALR